ncbi:hypothetical protein C1H46_005469 [Malus baccata]|uniref:Uncharacterized protein n=1 Tax=Malus baccata TaxID=106549 RepID=A0A540NCS9_MALBA|nr:hypothetical protein C1H46_005469 [Malus baccata]
MGVGEFDREVGGAGLINSVECERGGVMVGWCSGKMSQLISLHQAVTSAPLAPTALMMSAPPIVELMLVARVAPTVSEASASSTFWATHPLMNLRLTHQEPCHGNHPEQTLATSTIEREGSQTELVASSEWWFHVDIYG